MSDLALELEKQETSQALVKARCIVDDCLDGAKVQFKDFENNTFTIQNKTGIEDYFVVMPFDALPSYKFKRIALSYHEAVWLVKGLLYG
jgi:hypothetical protein